MYNDELSDEALPNEFQNIPIEFKHLQKKFDNQKIFTNVSNEIRLETRLRSHQYKEEHLSGIVKDAKPQYMAKIDNNLDMFREIESIIENEITNGMQAKMMKRSLMEAKAKTQTMGTSQSAGCIRKPRQKQGDKLPSIKKRYGSGVVSSWQKGPIDMPKDRYFDLNDRSIYGTSTDPRARQLRQQTKLLMNSFQTSNKKAHIHAICRKRRVNEFKEKGEDHIVGSYDDIVAAQQALDRSTNLNVDAKGLLEEVYENIKHRKRNMKRKSSSRILELWDVLMCPPSSKLAFKFQSELPVPGDILLATASPNKKSKLTTNDVQLHQSLTIICKLESLADSVHAMNVFVLILRLWRERRYPDEYTSSELMQPLIDVCRAGGVEKCVKKLHEHMRDWLARLCDELWKVLLPQLRFWISFSQKNLDKHFTNFVEELHQEIFSFVAIVEEEKMIGDEKEFVERNESIEKQESHIQENNMVNTVMVADLSNPSTTHQIVTELASGQEGTTEGDVETNIMKDESVKYNTKNLPKKSQKIYESLPPIVDSVNINKVTRNLLKEPNKILSKRLARAKAGLTEDDDM